MEDYNFIETYDNALSDEDCDLIIDIFEKHKSVQEERSDIQKENNVDDTFLSLLTIQQEKKVTDLLYRIDECLRSNFEKYAEKYKETALLDNEVSKKPLIREFKVQKTRPGQGYLRWHHERWMGGGESEKRFLVYTIYLNDINKGGETEFLYQKTSVSPKKGTLCLFPAEYTHVHRGNTPTEEVKYIITGWYFQQNL